MRWRKKVLALLSPIVFICQNLSIGISRLYILIGHPEKLTIIQRIFNDDFIIWLNGRMICDWEIYKYYIFTWRWHFFRFRDKFTSCRQFPRSPPHNSPWYRLRCLFAIFDLLFNLLRIFLPFLLTNIHIYIKTKFKWSLNFVNLRFAKFKWS